MLIHFYVLVTLLAYLIINLYIQNFGGLPLKVGVRNASYKYKIIKNVASMMAEETIVIKCIIWYFHYVITIHDKLNYLPLPWLSVIYY